MASLSYISDVTTRETRTRRISYLSGTMIIGYMLGVGLGSLLKSKYDMSYDTYDRVLHERKSIENVLKFYQFGVLRGLHNCHRVCSHVHALRDDIPQGLDDDATGRGLEGGRQKSGWPDQIDGEGWVCNLKRYNM